MLNKNKISLAFEIIILAFACSLVSYKIILPSIVKLQIIRPYLSTGQLSVPKPFYCQLITIFPADPDIDKDYKDMLFYKQNSKYFAAHESEKNSYELRAEDKYYRQKYYREVKLRKEINDQVKSICN